MLKSISARQLQLGLITAIGLQFVIVGLFYFNLIHDPNHQPGTFIFHQGGDQDAYFSLAQSLVAGPVIQSKYTLGYPLFLVPWIVLFKPISAEALTPIIAAFNAFILFPLSQLILARLALRITQQRTVTLISVLLWTCFPLILYSGLALTGRSELGAIWAVHLPWMQMLSDPPTTFLTLLSFWLLLIIVDVPAQGKSIVLTALLGIICGFLVLIRLNTVLTIGIILLVLMLKRRWLTLLIVSGLIGVLFIPQVLYNVHFFSSPFMTGYQILDQQPPNGLFSLAYPIKVVTSKYGFVIVGGALLVFALLAVSTVILWRKNRVGALIVALWSVSYILFFSLYYYSWTGSLTRFLIPMYPALAILICAPLLYRADANQQGHD